MRRPLNMLLLLLVIACGVSLWLAAGRPLPGITRTGSGAGVQPVAGTQAAPVHLRILNSTDKTGLAGEIALLLPRLGCVVEGVGNASGWPGSPTVLINRRLKTEQAAGMARLLGGIPVLREWDGRTTEDAVLVLGSDFEKIRATLKAARP